MKAPVHAEDMITTGLMGALLSPQRERERERHTRETPHERHHTSRMPVKSRLGSSHAKVMIMVRAEFCNWLKSQSVGLDRSTHVGLDRTCLH